MRDMVGGGFLRLHHEANGAEVDRTSMSIRFDLNMKFPTLVSCLHSAHLGQFLEMGYTYVDSESGWFVGSMLRDLYTAYSGTERKSARKQVRKHPSRVPKECQPYRNMVRPLPNAEELLDERLKNAPFEWFHVAWDGDTIFAAIYYIKARDECHAVMVYTSFDERSAAFVCAEQPLAFELGLARFVHGRIEFGTRRIPAVWPCGESWNNLPPCPIGDAAASMRTRMLRWPRNEA